MAAVPGSTSTAITSAMKPYVFDELTQSSWSTAGSHGEAEDGAGLEPRLHALGQRLGVPVRAPGQILDGVRRPLARLRPHRPVAELELVGRPLHQMRPVLDELRLELSRREGNRAGADGAEAARVACPKRWTRSA